MNFGRNATKDRMRASLDDAEEVLVRPPPWPVGPVKRLGSWEAGPTGLAGGRTGMVCNSKQLLVSRSSFLLPSTPAKLTKHRYGA